MYLAGLRVWIEKKFTENTNDLEGLKEKKQLSNKIIFMFDGNHWIGTNIYRTDSNAKSLRQTSICQLNYWSDM